MDKPVVLAICLAILAIGYASANSQILLSGSAGNGTGGGTNFTINITGQPNIPNAVTLKNGTNTTLTQDTANRTITIDSIAGSSVNNATIQINESQVNNLQTDLNSKVNKSGDNMGGDINMMGFNITNESIKTEKNIIHFHYSGSYVKYVNFTNLSINNDSFYKTYGVLNSTLGTTMRIFFNDDFNESNYSRQYVYGSGNTLVTASDFTPSISATSPGHSAETRLLIMKSISGTIRIVAEGNFDDGINFFNMQIYYHNKVTDLTKISLTFDNNADYGTDFYIFGLR